MKLGDMAVGLFCALAFWFIAAQSGMLPKGESGGWGAVLSPECWSADRPYWCDEARQMHDDYGERMGW